jgi:hypothetical protein
VGPSKQQIEVLDGSRQSFFGEGSSFDKARVGFGFLG